MRYISKTMHAAKMMNLQGANMEIFANDIVNEIQSLDIVDDPIYVECELDELDDDKDDALYGQLSWRASICAIDHLLTRLESGVIILHT